MNDSRHAGSIRWPRADPARLADVPGPCRPRPRHLRRADGARARGARARGGARGPRHACGREAALPHARTANVAGALDAPRRRVRALPRSLRPDRRARLARTARRHRARARRAQRRCAPRRRRGDALRRPPRGGRRLRLGVPAPRAGDEGAGRAREDGGRLERRRPRALPRRSAAGRPAALPLRRRPHRAQERRAAGGRVRHGSRRGR